jgi:hypothetical protein
MRFVAGKIGLRGSAELIPEKSHGAASSQWQMDETAPLSRETRHDKTPQPNSMPPVGSFNQFGSCFALGLG